MEYIVKRTNRKTLAISIVDGNVIVRAPKNLNDQIIERAVLDKKDWINSKLKAYRPVGIDLSHKTVRVYGKTIPLHLKKGQRFTVTLSDSLEVTHSKRLKKETIEKRIEDSFKEELHAYIDQKLTQVAKDLNIEKPPFIIRRYKRIYGRCNAKGELAFNLYLYEEAYPFIDYVILHECAHILEFNHSRAFYAIIEKHMPNYKEIIRLSKL